jgi:hypothetical protein
LQLRGEHLTQRDVAPAEVRRIASDPRLGIDDARHHRADGGHARPGQFPRSGDDRRHDRVGPLAHRCRPGGVPQDPACAVDHGGLDRRATHIERHDGGCLQPDPSPRPRIDPAE